MFEKVCGPQEHPGCVHGAGASREAGETKDSRSPQRRKHRKDVSAGGEAQNNKGHASGSSSSKLEVQAEESAFSGERGLRPHGTGEDDTACLRASRALQI